MNSFRSAMRKGVKGCVPPLLLNAYHGLMRLCPPRDNFVSWWTRYSKKTLPPDLVLLVDQFIQSPSFANSSRYWNYLNKINIVQLADRGYANLQQTLARNYFTWVDGLNTPYTQYLIENIGDFQSDAPINVVCRKHDEFTFEESVTFNIITALLYEFVSQKDNKGFLCHLTEPQEGNPPGIEINGKLVTQDLLNSALEMLSIAEGTDLSKVRRVLELGAGSGRTSYAFMKLFPAAKYVISDIPPALFISQTYLSSQFKDRRIFKFWPFKAFSEVEREVEQAEIVFLMPYQLDLLPAKFVDLFLAIDCLHEMKKDQVNKYFDVADRLASHFYFKCWEETDVPFDKVRHTRATYPVKTNWKGTYVRECGVPATFFEAFYQIKGPNEQ